MMFDQTHSEWNNWKWQLARSCKDFATLKDWTHAADSELSISAEEFDVLISNYRMGITPYYFSLIKSYDDSDPIFRQIIPSYNELNILPEELNDPIGDEKLHRGSQPLKALIHRYENRALLLPTAQCAVYCRFCFRKRLVGDTAHNARAEDLQAAYNYIEDHPEIEEIILTGGDPLTLGDQALSDILLRLEQVKHLRLIRIHTRLPVVNPFRLTKDLGSVIASLKKPVWIATHFNHPSEITRIADKHITSWIQMGIPFLNQSVLLKGVNDTPETLKELFIKLLEIKVKPYYLHQADMVKGTSHLRVRIESGLKLLKTIQGDLPGYALPHYVLDSPDGKGKLPLQNQY